MATDSEQVPRGKGEKHRCERSEIVPETIRQQGVKPSTILLPDKDGEQVVRSVPVGIHVKPGIKMVLGMACLLLNESASYCQWQA